MRFLKDFASQALISPNQIGYQGVTNANTGLQGILNAVYFWAGVVAVIVIVIAGFFYVTSQGDASKVKRSKDTILAAVIGLVVILSAFIVTQYVLGRF